MGKKIDINLTNEYYLYYLDPLDSPILRSVSDIVDSSESPAAGTAGKE